MRLFSNALSLLSVELLNTLIERVVVHEKEVIDGEFLMRVEIYYRFIGNVGGESDDLMAKKYRNGV